MRVFIKYEYIIALSCLLPLCINGESNSTGNLRKYFQEKQFETISQACASTIGGENDDLSCLYYLSLVNLSQKKTDPANKFISRFKESFRKKAVVSGSPEKGMLVILEKNRDTDQFQFIDIYYHFAKKEIEQQNCKDALYWLNAAKHPTNQDEFYLGYQAYCNYQYKRYEVSRNYYIQLATLFPKNYIALISVGATYARENNLTQAITWLEKAIKVSDKAITILKEDQDNDFANIRETKEYKALLRSTK